MKINEVEALAGITKKNIRFYEEQGLLNPKRNSDNGYRDYGTEEVDTLKRIKLLRKLGVPIEEIRQMQSGIYTLADGMRRHAIVLEREQHSLEQALVLCRELQSLNIPVADLDADRLLTRMEDMEKGGMHFSDKQVNDVRIRYVAPIVITAVLTLLLCCGIGLLFWAWNAFPTDRPPLWFIVLLTALIVCVIAGVIIALTQRIGEIRKGEFDDARRY